MPENQPLLPEDPDPDVAAIAAARLTRLRDRFDGRYDEAQWNRIAEAAERSVRRGIALRRFELANHDEPDPRFIPWLADGDRS